MEVISSDWIYIAANGRSGAVGWEHPEPGEEPGLGLCREEEEQHVYSYL